MAGSNGEARDAQIVALLPAIRGVAAKLRKSLTANVVELEDLAQAGVLGVIAALPRFDSGRGDLLTFALNRARGAMLDYLRENDRAPRYTRARARRVGAAYHFLEGLLGRPPEDDEVALKLGIGLATYTRWLRDLYRCGYTPRGRSLTADRRFSEWCVHEPHDPAPDPFERAARAEQAGVAQASLAVLNNRERHVMGLLASGLTWPRVAEVMERDESRVCQLRHSSIAKMRARIWAINNPLVGATRRVAPTASCAD